MDEDPAHSAQVTKLALELFDQTTDRHGLGDDAREVLEAAALLCNVGLFLSHAQHHKHSYYVIRSSEHLTGFNDREIELIAQVARYHRKSAPKSKHPEFAALEPEDQRLVSTVAGILRVAVGLDRNHSARVHALRCQDLGDHLEIAVAPEPGEDITLELYSASTRRDLLESMLGIPVEVA
jgi:exopolyphosphatase/guanosine-5'-triphosphate,3'-diphosphate pyrophosphatase